jgi:hypothetical protein
VVSKEGSAGVHLARQKKNKQNKCFHVTSCTAHELLKVGADSIVGSTCCLQRRLENTVSAWKFQCRRDC